MWVAAAVLLLLADLVTTLVGIRFAGPDAEDNPLWRSLTARHGLRTFVAGHLAIMAAIVFAASRSGDAAIAGWVAFMALVVANNLRVPWGQRAPVRRAVTRGRIPRLASAVGARPLSSSA